METGLALDDEGPGEAGEPRETEPSRERRRAIPWEREPGTRPGAAASPPAGGAIPPGGMEKFFPRSRKSPIQKGPFLVYWYHRTCILRDMNFEEVVTYECID